MVSTHKASAPIKKSAWIFLMTCAGVTLALILAQFLMAGLSMFHNGAIWKCHRAAGFLLALPIGLMLLTALLNRMRALSSWLALLAATYVAQILLIVAVHNGGSPIWQALHPFNGSLMLTIFMVVLYIVITNRNESTQNGSTLSTTKPVTSALMARPF